MPDGERFVPIEQVIVPVDPAGGAVQVATKPAPDKGTVLGHLTNTKTLVEGVAEAGGLVTALTKAVELVQQFF